MEKLTRATIGNLICELRIKSDMDYAKLVEKAIAVNKYFNYMLPEIAIRRNFTPEGLATIYLVQEGIDFEIEAHSQAVMDLTEAYGIYSDTVGKLAMLEDLKENFYFD